MSIIGFTIAIIPSTIIYFFYGWRRLREDLDRDKLFDQLSIIYISVLLSSFSLQILLGSRIKPIGEVFNPNGIWFWGGILGYIISYIFILGKEKIRYNELFQATSTGYLYMLTFLFAMHYYLSRTLISLYAFALLVIFLILYFVLEINYKKFNWYKSGKRGFASFLLFGLIFSLKAVVSYYFFDMFTSIGYVGTVFSSALAFLMFYTLYNLSQEV